MLNNRNYAKIETWTVEKLLDAASKEPAGKIHIAIPEFQRRLVWKKKQQEEFIDSIKKGYPFGSLLLYEDTEAKNQIGDNKTYYKLIDGLQRTNTLKSYDDDKNKFFNKENLPADFINFVAAKLGGSSKRNKDKIRQAIVEWVRSIRHFDEADWGTNRLTNVLIRAVSQNEEDTDQNSNSNLGLFTDDSFQNELAGFLQSVRIEADISNAKIPIVFYEGSPKDLPTAFVRLNKNGAKLSKYEIYAAQWFHRREPIVNEEIVDAIRKKYERLAGSYTLDASESTSSWREREYTLFDYVFGFGQWLSRKFKPLFKSVKDDEPSAEVFNLVPACLGLHVKDMDKLPEKLKGLDRSKLERHILETTTFVNDILKPVLSVSKPFIYHAEFQIASIIASAFGVRYNKEDLSEINGWQSKRKELKEHVLMHYLYDILRGYWRGTGDSKLYDTVNNLRYLKPPSTKNSWLQVLDDWYRDNQDTLLHERARISYNKPEILLLKYIYSKKFTVAENAETHHVEHIIPVAQIRSRMNENEKWPINTIGNLALLEAGKNMAKGDLTFVEYLDKKQSNRELTGEQYQAELEKYEELLICKADDLPSELTQRAFEDFLRQRFERLKAEFIKAWRDCIPTE